MSRNNFQALQYARGQLGRPYWMGTYGQLASEPVYKACKKSYPKYYTAKDFPSQYGKKVHDCGGLAYKGYMMSEGPDVPAQYRSCYDISVDAMMSLCKEKGPINTMPDIPGIFVWKKGHGGIYEGKGVVIEAKGHAYGVVRTTSTKWTHWGKIPWWEYITLSSWISYLYKFILGRQDDAPGLNYWLGTIRSHDLTPSEVVRAFLNSEEFKNKQTTDESFMKILYQVFFDREPDAVGLSYWLEQLPVVGRDAVVAGFIASSEWQAMEAYLLYI